MKKNLIIIAIVLVLGFFVIQYLNRDTSTTGSFSASVPTSESNDAKYIFNLLERVNRVGRLDDSIFNDPLFQTLKDNTVSFQSRQPGRVNPFAPIGATGAAAAAAAQQ